jgi:hypothetical protein
MPQQRRNNPIVSMKMTDHPIGWTNKNAQEMIASLDVEVDLRRSSFLISIDI